MLRRFSNLVIACGVVLGAAPLAGQHAAQQRAKPARAVGAPLLPELREFLASTEEIEAVDAWRRRR